MPQFLYDYNYKGGRYSVDIFADTKEDADAIIQQMPLAQYAGELYCRIYVPKFLPFKWVANIAVWLKNFKGGSF
jgi:hypothetical protein